MKTFTTGPWTVSRQYHDDILARDGRYVAACYGGYINGDVKKPDLDSECAANARLIAQAPEMLRKLEELYEWLDDIGDGAPDAGPVARRALNESGEIAELIRKGKGEL